MKPQAEITRDALTIADGEIVILGKEDAPRDRRGIHGYLAAIAYVFLIFMPFYEIGNGSKLMIGKSAV